MAITPQSSCCCVCAIKTLPWPLRQGWFKDRSRKGSNVPSRTGTPMFFHVHVCTLHVHVPVPVHVEHVHIFPNQIGDPNGGLRYTIYYTSQSGRLVGRFYHFMRTTMCLSRAVNKYTLR
ncbi:hypothetical protein BDFG_00481 [Blastomyces dermatitidis ATCC 26199]|nr:hypothetical protein BDFG_00481 [Blastomyces dermatitidis ATCC 26199]